MNRPSPEVSRPYLEFYSSRGLRLFPCYSINLEGRCDCPDPNCRSSNWGKHPRISQWPTAATTDLDRLTAWLEAWPHANWAWALDDDQFVVDCDPRNGGPRTEAFLDDWHAYGLDPPPTLFQLSGGGGLHAVYAVTGHQPKGNDTVTLPDGTHVPGVNVKGAGGYILVAPSNHTSGGTYQWIGEWTTPGTWPELDPYLQRNGSTRHLRVIEGNGEVARAEGQFTIDEWYRAAPEVTNGNQRQHLLRGIGWLHSRGRSALEIAAVAWSVAERFQTFDPAEPWTERDVTDLVVYAQENWEDPLVDGDLVIPQWQPAVVAPEPSAPEPDGEATPRQVHTVADLAEPAAVRNRASDAANAEELAARYFNQLRWTPQAGWLAWDGTRWKTDEALRSHRVVLGLADELRLRQARVEEEEREALRARNRRLESVSGIEACLRAAQHMLYQDLGDFDQQPNLLNCQNGTLDLYTGVLREHRAEDLLTRCSPTPYVKGAESELLDEYLDTFVPNAERRDWLFRLLGTCLVGGNPHRLLLFLIGPTTTGKSQLASALLSSLGDYAGVGSASAFRGNLDDRPRPDIMKLLACRLVVMEETSSHWELHADRLKMLTGEATVSVRGMRSDRFVERRPEFTPLFVANEAPQVKGADQAVQRRLLSLEFLHRPEREDPTKRRTFLEDPQVATALLSRLVAGLDTVAREGIGDLPSWLILSTMATYEQMDDVSEFIEAAQEDEVLVRVGTDHPVYKCVRVTDLHRCYCNWVKDHGDASQYRDRLGRKHFSARLQALGWEQVRSDGTRWVGWELRDPAVTYRPEL